MKNNLNILNLTRHCEKMTDWAVQMRRRSLFRGTNKNVDTKKPSCKTRGFQEKEQFQKWFG